MRGSEIIDLESEIEKMKAEDPLIANKQHITQQVNQFVIICGSTGITLFGS